MFSIQTASTGPSKIIHFLSGEVLAACSRKVLAKTPRNNCIKYIKSRVHDHRIQSSPFLNKNLFWTCTYHQTTHERRDQISHTAAPL